MVISAVTPWGFRIESCGSGAGQQKELGWIVHCKTQKPQIYWQYVWIMCLCVQHNGIRPTQLSANDWQERKSKSTHPHTVWAMTCCIITDLYQHERKGIPVEALISFQRMFHYNIATPFNFHNWMYRYIGKLSSQVSGLSWFQYLNRYKQSPCRFIIFLEEVMQKLSWLEPPGSSQFNEGNNNNTLTHDIAWAISNP